MLEAGVFPILFSDLGRYAIKINLFDNSALFAFELGSVEFDIKGDIISVVSDLGNCKGSFEFSEELFLSGVDIIQAKLLESIDLIFRGVSSEWRSLIS